MTMTTATTAHKVRLEWFEGKLSHTERIHTVTHDDKLTHVLTREVIVVEGLQPFRIGIERWYTVWVDLRGKMAYRLEAEPTVRVV